MRTNELHASAKAVQRSKGRSAVAAAAYRAGVALMDERTQLMHDYTNKRGVEYVRMYAPDNAPAWARDRGALWNAAEAKENRRNSITARELEIAFPHEFNAMQRREAGDKIARELMDRYGCAVDIAYHKPSRDGDQRNFHAHILFTGRAFDETSRDGWAKNRYRDLNNDPAESDGEKTTRAALEVSSLREFCAVTMNDIARRDKLEVHTEYLSFEARGVGKEPTKKLGPAAAEAERRGAKTDRGDENRRIQASNDNLAALIEQRKVIDLEIEREKRLIAKAAEKSNELAREISRDRERHRRREFFNEKRREEIAGIHAFYHVDRREQELKEASENLAAKQGIIARILGQTRRAREAVEVAQLNLQDAKAREAEAIAAINAKYRYSREEKRGGWGRAAQERTAANANEKTAQGLSEQTRTKDEAVLRAAVESPDASEHIAEAIQPKTAAQKDKVAQIKAKAAERRSKTAARQAEQAKERESREQESAREARKEAARREDRLNSEMQGKKARDEEAARDDFHDKSAERREARQWQPDRREAEEKDRSESHEREASGWHKKQWQPDEQTREAGGWFSRDEDADRDGPDIER